MKYINTENFAKAAADIMATLAGKPSVTSSDLAGADDSSDEITGYLNFEIGGTTFKVMYGRFHPSSLSSTITFPSAFTKIPTVVLSMGLKGSISYNISAYAHDITESSFVFDIISEGSMPTEAQSFVNYVALGI